MRLARVEGPKPEAVCIWWDYKLNLCGKLRPPACTNSFLKNEAGHELEKKGKTYVGATWVIINPLLEEICFTWQHSGNDNSSQLTVSNCGMCFSEASSCRARAAVWNFLDASSCRACAVVRKTCAARVRKGRQRHSYRAVTPHSWRESATLSRYSWMNICRWHFDC